MGQKVICYVILSRIYRSRVKDYAILRTLGVTKKDMAKIVNVEMIVIGYSVILFTYLLFNGLIFAVDALTFLRQIGILTVILYFGNVIFSGDDTFSTFFEKHPYPRKADWDLLKYSVKAY